MKNIHWVGGIAALVCAAASALAAPDTRYLPPPGLYQFDIVSNSSTHSDGETSHLRHQSDGASGAYEVRHRRADGVESAQRYAGAGPQRICMGPVRNMALPKGLGIDGCHAAKGQVVDGQMVALHTCPWGKMRVSMRQIDAKTWESTVESVTTGRSRGPKDYSFQRSMAEQAMQIGNAKQRAEARESLKLFKEMEAESKKIAEEAPKVDEDLEGEEGASMAVRGGPLRQMKAVTRMTRIGDCKD